MSDFRCPVCARSKPLKPELLGRKFRCPSCRSKVRVHTNGRVEVLLQVEPKAARNAAALAAISTSFERRPGLDDTSNMELPGSSSRLAPTAPLLTGLAIGGWQILDTLGTGSRSAVYLGEREGRRVALKILPPEPAQAVDLLLRQVQRLSRLDHPNLVRVLEAGRHGGGTYLAMERVEGPSLKQRVRPDAPFSGEALGRLVDELLEGLEAIHAAGFTHGDLRPSNVLFGPDGRARLSDFGLFAAAGEYAAPELALGRLPDIRSDLYSLGATLYAAATGRAPAADVPLHVFVPSIDASVELFILRLMDADREKRPACAADALASFKRTGGPASTLRRVASPGKSRRPALALAAAVAVAALSALLWPRSEPAAAKQPLPFAAPPAPKPPGIPSVLVLNTGEVMRGRVSTTDQGFEIDGRLLRADEVRAWYRTSNDMAEPGLRAYAEAKASYEERRLDDARRLAGEAETILAQTRSVFPDDAWVEPRLSDARRLAALIQAASTR
jgi:hypothetical protein